MSLIYFIVKISLYTISYGILMFFLGVNKEEKQLIIKFFTIVLKR